MSKKLTRTHKTALVSLYMLGGEAEQAAVASQAAMGFEQARYCLSELSHKGYITYQQNGCRIPRVKLTIPDGFIKTLIYKKQRTKYAHTT